MKMNIHDVIVKPIVTEKSYKMMATNGYVFEVHPDATKVDIKKAIEFLFKRSEVKVAKINIVNVRKSKKTLGRYQGYKKGYKKAMIYLSAGEIPIYGKDETLPETQKDNSKKKKKNTIITEDVLKGK